MDSKPAQICKSHLILSLTPRVVSCSFPKPVLSMCILVLRLILLCHQSPGRKSVPILPKKAFFHEFSEMGLSSLWRVHCIICHRLILGYATFLAEGMRTIMSNRQNEQNCSSMRFQTHWWGQFESENTVCVVHLMSNGNRVIHEDFDDIFTTGKDNEKVLWMSFFRDASTDTVC